MTVIDHHRTFQPGRRRTLQLAAATGLTTVGASHLFGNNARAQGAGRSGQVVVGFSQEPTVFNPHLLHIEVDEGVHFAIFDPLFDIDHEGNFYPVLAKEVPTVANGGVSADGLNWKVMLRDGVRWHDGKPFTAEDVKFTLELLVDPDFRSWRRAGHELVRDISVVSPTEITWRMEKPYAPYFSILASTFITPKHAFDGVADKNNAPFNNTPIGTGAFKFKNRVAGSHIELSANPDYFGDGPYLERVILRYIPDLTVLYTQFQSGDVDVTGIQGITADHYDEAKDLPGKRVGIDYSATIEGFGLNLTRPFFQERVVREAMYHALDKDAIINTIYYGLPKPVESYIPTQSAFYNPNLPGHEYNLDKAKALLDAAGWRPGTDGIRQKNGVRLAFSNSTTAGNHLREQAQQYVQQSFRAIGIDMTIRNLPAAVMWGEYWMMSQFDTTFVGIVYVAGADPDCSNYFHSSASAVKGGNGQNTFVYHNPQLDNLLEQGAQIFTPDERRATYFNIQETIRRDLPFLPIFQYARIRGYKNGMTGFQPNINNRIETWNIRSWRWA